MLLFLFIVFICVPILEIYVIIQVGGAIGVWPTIGLLILDSVLGAMLLRSQGRSAWRRFNAALAENRMPHREVFDGAMVIVGASLLLAPGFITDFLGLILLIPPTRDLIRKVAGLTLLKRISWGPRVAYWGYDRYDRSRHGSAGPRPDDIPGTAHEVGDPIPELPPDRPPPPE